MSTTPRHVAAGALALALALLAGCGDADRASAPSPSTSAPTAATPPSTTPPSTTPPGDAPITTTTQATPATPADGSTTASPQPKPPATVAGPVTPADGSGCSPGSGPLPDGLWFGYVSQASGTGFAFDVACWFTGRAASREAARDGQESPPPNDYYVRNASTVLRPVAFAGDTQVTWYRQTGDPTTEVRTTYDEWLAARGGSMVLGVWLEVRGGVAVTIAEQWVP